MRRTPFAGLTVLEPGEPFSTDGYSFQDRNPDLTDRLLRVGAVTHRHDEHIALADPTIAPSASAVASGGGFPAEVDAQFSYTFIDAYGGESMVAPLAEVTTPSKIQAPDPPSGSADYAAGALLAGTYSYVKTWVDGAGGETTPSFEELVTLDPGYASGRVRFSNLASGMVAAGAASWRLYKSQNGSYYHYIASGTTNTLDDDGSLCADCVTRPPTTNTTQDRNTVQVQMPASGALPVEAVAFRLYGSIGVGFQSPSFFGQYPRASGGSIFTFTAWNPGDGSPPPISTTLPGATKIDADTQIVNLHWKAPVANSGALPASGNQLGDARIALDSMTPYAVSDIAPSPDTWVALGGGGGGGGSWKDPVANVGALPSVGNTNGDVRVTLSTGRAYIWFTSSWTAVWPDPFGPAPADPHWKAPVANAGALPGGSDPGDIRLTLDTGILWIYWGSPTNDWLPLREHEAWVAPTLLNSWTDPNSANADAKVAYYSDRRRVYLRGVVSGGSNGNTIFNLPAAIIPAADHYLTVPQMDWVGAAATTHITIQILTSGLIVTDGYTATRTVALSGVDYPL